MQMQRGFSIWMDMLRVGATLVVLLSHLAYPRFSQGLDWVRTYNLGADAVIVFFVISGFVIAYAANRDGDLGTYGFNRLTRLWSVLLPAIILTLIFDQIGTGLDPSAYPTAFFHPVGMAEALLRGLSFSTQWGDAQLRLGTNGPLWSLSYEAAYYILFAAAFFLRGWVRPVVILILAWMIGPRVLLLMPAWAMGVGLYYAVQAEWHLRLSRTSGLALAVLAPLIYVSGLALGWPVALQASPALAFSAYWQWHACLGLMTVLHLVGMARILQGRWQVANAAQYGVRWAAGASFSIYVTHYPALHLLDAALPVFTGRVVVLAFGALLIGVLFAQVFERPLTRIRAMVRALVPRAKGLRKA